ncbi:MAG: hypothetical protein F6Q13_01585 [Mycobacterium sp.]|nr:MAG: hypothetical protein F6Q13_01585 [Mycobacterium sp.]
MADDLSVRSASDPPSGEPRRPVVEPITSMGARAPSVVARHPVAATVGAGAIGLLIGVIAAGGLVRLFAPPPPGGWGIAPALPGVWSNAPPPGWVQPPPPPPPPPRCHPPPPPWAWGPPPSGPALAPQPVTPAPGWPRPAAPPSPTHGP